MTRRRLVFAGVRVSSLELGRVKLPDFKNLQSGAWGPLVDAV